LVGAFCRTLGGRPKNKGFGNPFQISPTPCKNSSKPNPKSIKKMKKLRDFGEIGVREKWGESGENGVFVM
jgi:hypothetical protein